MYNRGCAYGHNCTDQAARATPIDSATPKTKARTAAFVEAQAIVVGPFRSRVAIFFTWGVATTFR